MRQMIALALLVTASASGSKFYADDPLLREPKPMRVEKARSRNVNDWYDFYRNTFRRPGERQTKQRLIPAQVVNTLGEVLDGAWYENRHYRRRMSLEQIVRGPSSDNAPSMGGPWKVVTAKSEGVTPGFLVEDLRGRRYFLKFDPPTNPEMATAADVIGAAFFHALGYHVPENYIVRFARGQLLVTRKSMLTDHLGKRRTMTERDVDEVLMDAPREHDGRYRAVASLLIKGEILGPFRFHGTRKDDPNDVVVHEHRRDLRGLFVFAAWLGHDDSRAINTLDALVEENGSRYIKHHLIDFGSILGSASLYANSPRSGNENLFNFKSVVLQTLTLGLYVPRWARVRFPDYPSVGRFEYESFEPEKYKPEYPNPAFENRLADDTFWAARQVMAFTDSEIRAVVKKGEYSDPGAEDWIVRCLIARRDKIGRTYFSKVLPLDRFRVGGGRLEFDDLAVTHGLTPAREDAIRWARFDNKTERHSQLDAAGPLLPKELRTAGAGEYFAAEIRGDDSRKSVTVYLRMQADGAQLVGLDRKW